MPVTPQPQGLSTSLNRSLSDQVAAYLRQAIQDGRIAPGQRLIEEQIARAVQMSRGPVRDALRILENERLVIRYANRGAFAAALTLRDAEEIFSLRQALEGVAIEYAIKSASAEQIAALDAIVQRMAELCEQDYTPMQATEIDLDFHYALCEISGHSRVLAAWSAQRVQVGLLIMTHRTAHPDDFRNRAVDYHGQLVDAILRRDARLASGLLHVHMAASLQGVEDAIKQQAEITAHRSTTA